MSNEKKPERLTDIDFIRSSPAGSPKLRAAVEDLERVKELARDRQIHILVTVREVAIAIKVPFEELVEESLVRFRESQN